LKTHQAKVNPAVSRFTSLQVARLLQWVSDYEQSKHSGKNVTPVDSPRVIVIPQQCGGLLIRVLVNREFTWNVPRFWMSVAGSSPNAADCGGDEL